MKRKMHHLSVPLLLVLASLLCLLPTAVSSAPLTQSRPFRARDPLTAHYQRQQRGLSGPPIADTPYNWTTLTYSGQYVDHFGFTESQTFEQRYLVTVSTGGRPATAMGRAPSSSTAAMRAT